MINGTPSAEAVRLMFPLFQVLPMQQASTQPQSACLTGSNVAVAVYGEAWQKT